MRNSATCNQGSRRLSGLVLALAVAVSFTSPYPVRAIGSFLCSAYMLLMQIWEMSAGRQPSCFNGQTLFVNLYTSASDVHATL